MYFFSLISFYLPLSPPNVTFIKTIFPSFSSFFFMLQIHFFFIWRKKLIVYWFKLTFLLPDFVNTRCFWVKVAKVMLHVLPWCFRKNSVYLNFSKWHQTKMVFSEFSKFLESNYAKEDFYRIRWPALCNVLQVINTFYWNFLKDFSTKKPLQATIDFGFFLNIS